MSVALSLLARALVDLLLPARCLGCGREGAFFCHACEASLPLLLPPFCRLCAQPLQGGDLCPRCSRAPLPLEGIHAPFLMQGLAREAVHRLKYRGVRALAGPMGRLMLRHLAPRLQGLDGVVPVPLHPRRRRQRGYNQAGLLAREVARGLGLPLWGDVLARVRPTPSQAESPGREARWANLQGAFSATAPLEGRRVLLVDDVCTTGATLSAAALALKDVGASAVTAAVFAREP